MTGEDDEVNNGKLWYAEELTRVRGVIDKLERSGAWRSTWEKRFQAQMRALVDREELPTVKQQQILYQIARRLGVVK